MIHARSLRYTIASILLGFAIACSASAGIVTLDVAAKSAVSDTTKLAPSKVNVAGDQVGFLIKSTILTPQKFTLKLAGAKEDDYDLYVNGSFVGKKTFRELTTGIELSTAGRVVDETQFRCARLVEAKLDAEMKRLGQPQGGEPQRVSYTLGLAREGTHLIVGKEETYRSVNIILASAGKVLKQMPSRNRLDAEQLAEALSKVCGFLQEARSRMYQGLPNSTSGILDPVLRNRAVAALTPVDLSISQSNSSGKQRAVISLVNNCDLPVSGSIALELPKGWKADAKSLKPIALASGKAFRQGVDLVPPAPGAVLAEPVKVSAELTVEKEPYLAKFTLTATAGGVKN